MSRADTQFIRILPGLLLLPLLLTTSGCIGTVVGAATSVAVEAAKVPFKVGGAVIDVATGDDEDDEKSGEE